MSTGGFRIAALRVKLPCEDEKDFYARFADAIAEKGLRVPTANLRPIGSKVRVVLEFRDGRTVSGEAVVDAHLEGAKPAMNVRLLQFEKTSATPPPAAARAPAAVTPVPAPPVPAPAVASPAAPAPTPPPETSFESLFPQADGQDEASAAEPPRTAAPGTEELEPLFGAAPAGAAAAGAGRDAAPEPTPDATPAKAKASVAAARHPAIPPASKRAAIVAVSAAVVLGLGLLVYSATRSPAPGRETPAPATPPPEAVVAARIADADRRLAEGRLTGPDGALDPLLAARALAPEDARVRKRLAMLADTLEKLGSRAADRGDVAEAEVHLAAALQAAPERQAIAARLEALAKLPRTPARRERPATDAEPER